ncbi:unnamed protein product [Cuscuta europaea]|uniref:RING-type E3 ubiquitin transferase n=1 Tax=Cuscuta europaea TaxID=41803 RepID=A0A9P1EDK8_CUSEU|nr:unnamed protein product [Cuscuta europaea]
MDETHNNIQTIIVSESYLAIHQKCIICLTKFELGDEASMLYCKHIFHSICIASWLMIKNICPICRRDVCIPIKSLISLSIYNQQHEHERRGMCSRFRQLMVIVLWHLGTRLRLWMNATLWDFISYLC